MRSLTLKLTLAFLVVSLAGIALVALFAVRVTASEFGNFVGAQNRDEIVEQLASPIKLPIAKGVDLKPGHIVKLVRTPDDVFCTFGDNASAFGIVTGPIDDLGFAPVLSAGAAIILVGLFEETLGYFPGALIYSNNEGLITTREIEENSILLAYVIAGNTNGRDHIEINWI